MLTGKHLIAGQWVDGDGTFTNQPVTGEADVFSRGTATLVEQAANAAEEAFWSFGYSERSTRATFLRRIADEIEARGDALTEIGMKETGLPEARLNGERGRTTGQLKLFADHIEDGTYLDNRHDEALPDREPLPRPDLKLVQRPVGPVAVFGASNFPLAFSTAGGDTAAALAAGCPVVVKGHPAHPGVSDIVAQAIDAARADCDLHPGVFSHVQDGGSEVGAALVQHPLIKAVGFTGSLNGGRALFDLCAARPEPIPFFGELGSVNPMFVLPGVLAKRGTDIAKGWAGSLTMGAGQFCTNPGVVVIIEGDGAIAFTEVTAKELRTISAQTMLTDGIATAFERGKGHLVQIAGVKQILQTDGAPRQATPQLLSVQASEWLNNAALSEEVFGPLGIVVIARDMEEMTQVARSLSGQLTCTIHMSENDTEVAHNLMPILERKAGRILANGFPTGVEVSDAMVHGGPYPASTNFGATSVGTLSIRRFLRPVCYQNLPDELLPK